MSECSAVREQMALLITESLDATRREHAHQHIEGGEVCGGEWGAWRDTWALMAELPEVEVPARVKTKFLAAAGIETPKPANVVPFVRRPAVKWLAQAAAVVVLAGGAYFMGDRNAERVQPTLATIDSVTPSSIQRAAYSPLAVAETRVVDADAISPIIEGRPNITNVKFVDNDASNEEIQVSFDITSRWTVTGDPKDKAIVRLASYMLENEDTVTPRAGALEWVSRTYSDPANADPEIASALAKVLRTDSHEGVRIRAVETLTTLPAAVADDTRSALINALKNDPNPAVRIKAVEALLKMAQSGTSLDSQTVDTLRQKAVQSDEVMYVRVKAAEALGEIDKFEQ